MYTTNTAYRLGILFWFLHLGFLASSQTAPNCGMLPEYSSNNTFSNVTVNTVTTRTGQHIKISGTVNFNANVNFFNCTILMEEGAVVNINNAHFNLWANANGPSLIFGCNKMWQAININANSSVSFRGSTIRNGRQGLTINPGFNNLNSEIVDCIFDGNSAAITATNVPNFTFTTFSGNHLLGTTIKPLMKPHLPNEPIFGMYLRNCVGTIGTSGAANRFTNFSQAFRAIGGTYTINNCSFENNNLLDWEGFGTGIGIWVYNANLTIDNIFSNGASCQFIGNRRALRFDLSGVLVLKNAVFSNSQVVDVEVVNSLQPYNINISSNRFNILNPTQQSVFIDRAVQSGAVHTRVQSNIFNLPAGGPALNNDFRFIDVVSRPGTTDQAIIADNQITCAYGNGPAGAIARTTDGIWIEGTADGYQVSGNIINFTKANNGVPPNNNIDGVAIGMTQNHGTKNIIGPNNTITSTLFPNQNNEREAWLRCGVHVNASVNTVVCNNDVDGTRHNYHFTGDCSNGEFGRNKIRNAYYGVAFTWASFPNQDYRMNEWDIAAVFQEYSIFTNTNVNTPWLADGNLPGHVPSGTQFMLPVDFITNMPNGSTSRTICDGVLPPSSEFGEPPTGANAVDFLHGKYSFANYAASWDFERNLLALMLRFPNSFAGNKEASNYFNSKLNSSIYDFAKAERLIHNAAVLYPTQQQSLDQYYEDIVTLTDNLGKIELQASRLTASNEAEIQATKSDLLMQLNAKTLELNRLLADIKIQRLSNYQAVAGSIEGLASDNILDNNRKTVLAMRLKSLQGIEWTDADYEILRSIAYSCPETGGEAVIEARGMLPAPERYTFPKEVEVYCNSALRSDDNLEQFVLSGATVFPNPANDKLTIGFSAKYSGAIEVRNLNGYLVLSKKCTDSISESFDTSAIPTGIYFVNLNSTNGTNRTIKANIIH